MRALGRVLTQAINGWVGTKVGTKIEIVGGKNESGVIEEPIGEMVSVIDISLRMIGQNLKSLSLIRKASEVKTCWLGSYIRLKDRIRF